MAYALDPVAFASNALSFVADDWPAWGAMPLQGRVSPLMFELPAAAGFGEAITRVPPGGVVSFSPFVDETAAQADLLGLLDKDPKIAIGLMTTLVERLRKADEKPTDPDVYPIGGGLVRMSDRGTEYPPIRDLKTFPRK